MLLKDSQPSTPSIISKQEVGRMESRGKRVFIKVKLHNVKDWGLHSSYHLHENSQQPKELLKILCGLPQEFESTQATNTPSPSITKDLPLLVSKNE